MAAQFDINIRTTADGSGAQKVASSLDQVARSADLAKAKLEQAAAVNRALTAEQDKVSKSARDSAAAFKEAFAAQDAANNESKRTEQASAAVSSQLDRTTRTAEKATLTKDKLAGAFEKLTRVSGSFGAVAGFIRHPVVGLTAAIAYLISAIEKKKKAFDDAAEADGEMSAKLTTLHEQLTAQRGAWDDYAASIARSAEAAKGFKSQLDAFNTTIAATLEGQQKFIDLQRQISEMEIKARQARGEITDEEAGRQLAGVGLKAEKRGEEVADEAMVARLQAIEREIEQRKALLEEQPGALNKAKAELERFKVVESGPGGMAEQRSAAMTASQAKVKELESEMEKASSMGALEWIQSGGGRNYEGSVEARMAKAKREAKIERLRAEIEGERRIQGTILRSGDAAGRRLSELQSGATNAEQAFTSNRDALGTLETQRNTLSGQILRTRQRREAAAPLKRRLAEGVVPETPSGIPPVMHGPFLPQASFIPWAQTSAVKQQQAQKAAEDLAREFRAMANVFAESFREMKDELMGLKKKVQADQGR